MGLWFPDVGCCLASNPVSLLGSDQINAPHSGGGGVEFGLESHSCEKEIRILCSLVCMGPLVCYTCVLLDSDRTLCARNSYLNCELPSSGNLSINFVLVFFFRLKLCLL